MNMRGKTRTVIKKSKAGYRNFAITLKNEVKDIVLKWSQHTFLYNKSIGEIIYQTGRNASACGGSGQHNARYDYSCNYRHIDDVSIILELIVRYWIEKINSHSVDLVERRKKFYIQYNGYEKLFKRI